MKKTTLCLLSLILTVPVYLSARAADTTVTVDDDKVVVDRKGADVAVETVAAPAAVVQTVPVVVVPPADPRDIEG